MISLSRNVVKNVIFIILTIVIMIVAVLMFIGSSYFEDIKEIITVGKKEKNLITEMTINGIVLPYDNKTSTFYFPVATENLTDNEEELYIEINNNSNKNLNCVIGDYNFSTEVNMKNIDFSDTLELFVESGFYYKTYYIKFTNSPVINIDYDSEKYIDSEYINTKFYIIDPDYKENNAQYQYFSDAKIRTRGGSSLNFTKKSYRFKLIDNFYDNDVSLLGMRKDSTWILDSLYSDDSKSRIKLSYNIWNQINNDLSIEEYATLNCEYVEVFIKDEYVGLYLLKEIIDEDSLNLNQNSINNSGVLIKGTGHSNIDFTEEKISNIESNIYNELELKYPENMANNSLYWKTILSKMKNYYSGNVSYENIKKDFNLDNFINYRIFLLLAFAADNYEPKNVYFSINDLTDSSKVILTPWDLDLTFGLSFYEGEQRGKKMYENVDVIYEIPGLESLEYKEAVKARWDKIKQNGLNVNTIDELLNDYYTELTTLDLVNRDYDKWIKADLKQEIEEIKDWWHKRFYVIDDYISSL